MPALSDFICGGERRAPRSPLPAVNPLMGWRQPAQSGLRATWLGHSTVLVEIDGWRVLTDPVWGPRASPSRFVGPKHRLETWWRGVDDRPAPRPAQEAELPKDMPWPID